VGRVTATVDSLATPTSVLVSTAAPETPEWYAQRRAGITATDLPKILGLSRYGNALSVWADKRGDLPPDTAGEAALWGKILEEPVAQEWAARNGVNVLPIGTVAHGEHRWQLASLDRLVIGCPDGPCPLEVKTRSAFVGGDWRGDIPDDVLAQVTWQMHVTGYTHTHLAVLIGGQELRSFIVPLDPDVEALVTAEATRVWGHVQTGTPPDVDNDEVLLRVLQALYPDRAGEVEADAALIRELVAAYDEGSAQEAAGKHRKTQAKAGLVALMGADGDRIVIDGLPFPAVTYKTNTAGHRCLRISKALREAGSDD
jgi:putative phage-type endonuclease